MRRRNATPWTVLWAVLALTGCQGEQPTAAGAAGAQPESAGSEPAGASTEAPQTGGDVSPAADVAAGAMRRSGPPVRLPAAVREAWSAVRLAVIDQEGARREVRAALGEGVELESAGLTLRASHFLPSYMSDDQRIYSPSNETNNPAVLIALSRDGRVINEGWVFRDYPQFNTLTSHWVRVELLRGERRQGDVAKASGKGGGA